MLFILLPLAGVEFPPKELVNYRGLSGKLDNKRVNFELGYCRYTVLANNMEVEVQLCFRTIYSELCPFFFS